MTDLRVANAQATGVEKQPAVSAGGRYGTRGILAYTAHETDFHRLCSVGDFSFTRSLCPRLNPSGQRSRFRDAVDRLSRAARRKLNPRILGALQLLANVCLWH